MPYDDGDARVLAQRGHRPAGLGGGEPPVEPQHQREEAEAQEVVAVAAGEQLRTGRGLAALATGEGGDAEQRLLGERAVGEGHQREVEAGEAQRHRPEQHGLDAAEDRGHPDRQPEAELEVGHDVRRGEGADADEGLVAEGDLAAVAEQDVERQATDGVDRRQRGDVDVGTPTSNGDRKLTGKARTTQARNAQTTPRANQPPVDGRNSLCAPPTTSSGRRHRRADDLVGNRGHDRGPVRRDARDLGGAHAGSPRKRERSEWFCGVFMPWPPVRRRCPGGGSGGRRAGSRTGASPGPRGSRSSSRGCRAARPRRR